MKEEILQNIAVIQERINNACKENGRNLNEVKLLLATKTVPEERIKRSSPYQSFHRASANQ
jgi:uncharacterized pyridoxal phosphate-containing UPF0001 family protein